MGLIGPIRFVLSTTFMLGVAPQYMVIWLGWRALSILLPSWIYQKGDDMCFSLYQRLVLFFFEHCTGVQVHFYGDSEEIFSKKERVLYLSNHQSTVDWILCNMIALRQGSLGQLRYVMKDALQSLPLYGHYFYQHGCIYVKRSNFKREKMMKGLDYLQNPKIPTWLVIFPEGTRYSPSATQLIEKSEQAARDANLPVLTHHLTPRCKGTWLTLNKLQDYLDAVYDITVIYGGTYDGKKEKRLKAPQLVDFLLGHCSDVHIHVKRRDIVEVPRKEDELRAWMHQLFVEKDSLVSSYYTGEPLNFGVSDIRRGHPHNLAVFSTAVSFIFFTCTSVPLIVTEWGRSFYMKAAFYCSLIGYAWLAVKSVC